MSFIVVDCEADGPIPGEYSMISFGAVIVEEGLNRTFYGELCPISNKYIPEALAVSGFSREETWKFKAPKDVMKEFSKWVKENTKGRPIFISDNLAFDWMFICYYLHLFTGDNPFGFSGRRIGDLWCGYKNDLFFQWKYMRKTKHTHNPVDDAIGNAEAILEMKKQGLNIKL